jgi:hypothetical protein
MKQFYCNKIGINTDGRKKKEAPIVLDVQERSYYRTNEGLQKEKRLKKAEGKHAMWKGPKFSQWQVKLHLLRYVLLLFVTSNG